MIATDTQTATLRELTEIADSGTWGNEGRPGDGSPVLRSSDIADNTLSFHDAAWRTIPENDRERRKLATGDIIVTKSSGSPEHIGKCAVFTQPDDGRDYYFSNFMLRIRAKRGKADHRWLFYWLSSERGRDVLTAMNSTTSGLRNLSVPRYLEQEVPIPFPDDPRRSLAEQKRIAAILDKADAIRRRRQEAARLADTLIPSVFYEMFGDPSRNPKAFPVLTFDEVIADTQYGTAAKSETHGRGLPVLRMNNITSDGNFDLTDLKWSDLLGDDADNYTLVSGDLLFNRTNSPELVGKTAVWKSDDRFAFAGYLIRVRFHRSAVAPDYASAYLNSRYGKQMLRAHAQPSINMSNISASSLRRMNIMVPPITLQHEFAKQVDEVAKLRHENELRIREANLLFSSLVQRAFQGGL